MIKKFQIAEYYLQNGESVLHVAVLGGHVDIVKLLLRYGANPVLKNLDGSTPTQLAFQSRDSRMQDLFKTRAQFKSNQK